MNMYLLSKGEFYCDSYPMAVYDKKKDAIRDLRKQGYKYNKEQKLFYSHNDPIMGDSRYIKIEKIDKNTL